MKRAILVCTNLSHCNHHYLWHPAQNQPRRQPRLQPRRLLNLQYLHLPQLPPYSQSSTTTLRQPLLLLPPLPAQEIGGNSWARRPTAVL